MQIMPYDETFQFARVFSCFFFQFHFILIMIPRILDLHRDTSCRLPFPIKPSPPIVPLSSFLDLTARLFYRALGSAQPPSHDDMISSIHTKNVAALSRPLACPLKPVIDCVYMVEQRKCG